MSRKGISRVKKIREIKQHYPEGVFVDLCLRDGVIFKDANIPLRFFKEGHIFSFEGGLLCGLKFRVVEAKEGFNPILEEIEF